MSYKYILTTKEFFKEGPCGRVSHAKGFVEGLSENEKDVTIVSYDGAKSFINANSFINFIIISNFLSFFREIFVSIIAKERIVIRWRPFLPFVFLPFLIFYKKIYFELNSITGLNSPNTVVRFLVKLSIYIISKFSKIIVVSENSKLQVCDLVGSPKSIYVMPNGFSSKRLSSFKPKISDSKVNFVYFGRKQDYYDWDNIYRFFELNQNFDFHVFGFEDLGLSSNIKFHGAFNHEALVKELNCIDNPILIIHPDDSETAKSGSPMKLFEYAFLNLPIIVGDSLKDVNSKFSEFIYYNSGDYESLKYTILNTAENYTYFLNKSKSLSVKVEKEYSWEHIIKIWLDNEKIKL